MNERKGITLIALILTVIVMIILAGISISALVGDNGIITQAMNAKNKTEDESAKEELQLVWSARMSKFYEELSRGTKNGSQLADYFSSEDGLRELNSLLKNGGEILSIEYIPGEQAFSLLYKNNKDINYLAKIKTTGEILSFEKVNNESVYADNGEDNTGYTEVWASYYEDAEGKGVLTYASSKDLRDPAMPVGADSEEKAAEEKWIQWDISNYNNMSQSNLPWYNILAEMVGNNKFKMTEYGYFENIYNIKILDEIVPKNTDFLFCNLKNAENIEHLERIFGEKTNIGEYTFYECNSLTSITIPASVTSIGKYAFSACSSLTAITIPANVTSIGKYAFSSCSSLTTIAIPIGITTIEDDTFSGCEALNSISIPNTVTSIKYRAFGSCASLTSITIPSSVTDIGANAFSGCSSLTSITIPDGITEIKGHTFEDCSSLTSIVLPDSLTAISGSEFSGCNSLTTINIPDSVTSIGIHAFYKCSSLKSITIPDGVTTIKTLTFGDCSNLTSITIPNSVTSIENLAFAFCSSVKSITLPDNLESIGSTAFRYCSSLTSIVIPSSVTSIGERAFEYCSNLQTIRIEKANGSISGAPWSAPSTTNIVWDP